MKIRVSTISPSGLKIDSTLPLEPLNERLKGGSTDDGSLDFIAPPVVDLMLKQIFGGVEVKGTVTGKCRQRCSTCSDPIEHEVRATIDLMLQSLDTDAAAPEDALDDPGVVTYSGEHADLEEPMQEALILTLSPFWHPPRDKSERCTSCGRDCSQTAWTAGASEGKSGTRMADLLQGAAAKARK